MCIYILLNFIYIFFFVRFILSPGLTEPNRTEREIKFKITLPTGFEPMTLWLTATRSTY